MGLGLLRVLWWVAFLPLPGWVRLKSPQVVLTTKASTTDLHMLCSGYSGLFLWELVHRAGHKEDGNSVRPEGDGA